MDFIDNDFVKTSLHKPLKDSHKGENGKLTIVGGSKLFHGASLWALKTASRIVDMVYYASVPDNLELVKNLKESLYDFIAIPREKTAEYIEESDAVLIGPGLVRGSGEYTGTGETGAETKNLVTKLLGQFPDKRWVLDAGALQVITPEILKKLSRVLITPHRKEFENLFEEELGSLAVEQLMGKIKEKASEYGCVIVLKGKIDLICSSEKCFLNPTGNEGMTKGGTGDVLAGLIAALACKNDLLTAAAVGTYVNGLAGDQLYRAVGPYFNASDLCAQVPHTLHQLTK